MSTLPILCEFREPCIAGAGATTVDGILIPLARRIPSISGAGATTDAAGEATVRIESWLASGVGPITSAKSAGKTNFERVVAESGTAGSVGLEDAISGCSPAFEATFGASISA
jgi:hypothetical protein